MSRCVSSVNILDTSSDGHTSLLLKIEVDGKRVKVSDAPGMENGSANCSTQRILYMLCTTRTVCGTSTAWTCLPSCAT